MYFRESDTLLQNNPEYEIHISTIDNFLEALKKEERQQLNIDVVTDLTGVNKRIVEFIFNNYCKLGLLEAKKYLRCPKEFDIIKEINNLKLRNLPEFCDICGIEHVFTEGDIVIRYSFVKPNDTNDAAKGSKPKYKQMQLESEEPPPQSKITLESAEMGNISYPKCFVSKKEKEIVKIATVQLHFELSATFPPEIIDKEKTKAKIISALEKANDNQTDIVCLPELCICEEWLPDLNQFPNMIIIAGSYYDKENHNICQILAESNQEIPPQIKIKPSEFETPEITGRGMTSGNNVIIYETRLGTFSVLICRDFGNFVKFLANNVDIIFVPSYNEKPDRFNTIAHSHVFDHPSYIVISNTSLYGGSAIFGQLDKVHFMRLRQAGFKEKEDETLKLCSIREGKEGIIIADFNLDHKEIQKLTPMDSDDVIRCVKNIRILDL